VKFVIDMFDLCVKMEHMTYLTVNPYKGKLFCDLQYYWYNDKINFTSKKHDSDFVKL
jgi:hypothetical protein